MDIKTFLDQDNIKELIAAGDLEAVYREYAPGIYYPGHNELSEYLLGLGINPIDYFNDSIPVWAFASCDSLVDITIPGNITTIGECAFRGCDYLKNVRFGENSQLITIEYSAFYDCASLTSIVIPEGVTTIGDAVFEDCDSLASICIPSTVTDIGQRVFNGCATLTAIHYASTIEQWRKINKHKTWSENSAIGAVYCIDGNIPFYNF